MQNLSKTNLILIYQHQIIMAFVAEKENLNSDLILQILKKFFSNPPLEDHFWQKYSLLLQTKALKISFCKP